MSIIDAIGTTPRGTNTPAPAPSRTDAFESVLQAAESHDAAATSERGTRLSAPMSDRGQRSSSRSIIDMLQSPASRIGRSPTPNAMAVAAAHATPRPTNLGEQLAAVASEYRGLPASAGSSDPLVGFGSPEFVSHALSRIGVSVPPGAPVASIGVAVPSLSSALPGDLIVTATGTPGVYVGNGDVALADTRLGKITITRLQDAPAAIRRIARPDAAPLAQGDTLTLSDVVDVSLVEGHRPAGSMGSLDGVPYADLFIKEGAEHGVDPRLLAAVAWQESRYTPTAVSKAGAQGLMQIMPATARGLGVENSFDPAQAVDGAARLLSSHLRKYDGSVKLALAAYNAGGGAVDRHGGVPPYKETQHYVVAVQKKFEELSA